MQTLISRLLYVKCFFACTDRYLNFFSDLNITRLTDLSNCHLANSPYHFKFALFNYTHANDNEFSLRAIKKNIFFSYFDEPFSLNHVERCFGSWIMITAYRDVHEDTGKWIDSNTCGWLKVSCRT